MEIRIWMNALHWYMYSHRPSGRPIWICSKRKGQTIDLRQCVEKNESFRSAQYHQFYVISFIWFKQKLYHKRKGNAYNNFNLIRLIDWIDKRSLDLESPICSDGVVMTVAFKANLSYSNPGGAKTYDDSNSFTVLRLTIAFLLNAIYDHIEMIETQRSRNYCIPLNACKEELIRCQLFTILRYMLVSYGRWRYMKEIHLF